MRFDLITFDLDGTLVDSLRDLAESVNALLVERGAQPLAEVAIGRMVGDGAATLVARALAASNVPDAPDALARFLAIYDARLLQCTRAYPGIPELLAELTRIGVPLAVLTNKPIGATRRVLEGLGLASYFAPGRVLGGDGPLPRKPDPAALLRLAEMAGTDAGRTLLVGDSIVDWRTARAADARICMARYGFGFHDFPAAELRSVDQVVDTPLDLLAIL